MKEGEEGGGGVVKESPKIVTYRFRKRKSMQMHLNRNMAFLEKEQYFCFLGI